MIPETEKAPTMGKIVRATHKKRMTEILYTGTARDVNDDRCICWLIRDGNVRRTVVTTHRGLISLLREGFLFGGGASWRN